MTAEVLEYAYNITRMFPFNTLKNLKDLRQEDFPFSGVAGLGLMTFIYVYLYVY